MYQRALEQCLAAQGTEVEVLGAGTWTAAGTGGSAAETARDAVLAEKLVREAVGVPRERSEATRMLDAASNVLERLLAVLLGIVAVTVLVGGVMIMLNMDAASRSQGGRFYVAVIMVMALGALSGQYLRLLRRRHPRTSAATTVRSGEERRYALGSLAALLVLTLLLIGFALLDP